MGAPTSAPDPEASGRTTEWHVIEVTEDKNGLETSSLHEVYQSESAAIAECDRMNQEHGSSSLLGAGDSVRFIVFEEQA